MTLSAPVSKNHVKQLCPCGKTNINELQRVSRGVLVKTFLFWLPLKRYKCYKCQRTVLIKYRPSVLRNA